MSGNVLVGIRLDSANNNVIDRNNIDGNLDNGVLVVNSDGVTILANLLRGNQLDGINLDPQSDTATIANNGSHRNTDDGIDTDNRTSLVGSNRTDENGNLGIEAVARTRDAGSNVAHNNGDDRQCVEVRCG
jgi:parallel beta-helix repeat protein